MRHLRRLIIASLIGVTLLFNIERLDFGRENIVDIDSFVYVLGIIAAISIITLPILWRAHVAALLVLWPSIYLLGKLFIFNQRPLLGGIYTYLSITEVTLLAIAIWLSHLLARAIHDFEQAVENITLRSASRRVRRLNEAMEDIQIEMFRSRHNHHPLSVVVVEPKPESIQASLHQAVREVQETMLHSYIINSLAQTLSKYLRRTDMILEQRDVGRFIILCPETSVGDLNLLVEYIQTIVAKQLGTAVACGVATFPNEALTFEELIHRAEAQLRHFNNGKSDLGEAKQVLREKPAEALLGHKHGNGRVAP
jgi:hypothetical protein